MIHTLQLKLWPFEVSPYVCIGSHAFAMFPPTRYVRGGATRAHKRDDLYPISSKFEYRLPACIVWLYYASSSTMWWFSDNFFLLSVLVSLKKKKKKALFGLIKHVGVFLALCGVCACALMQVLLLPIGRGFTGQCLDIGAWDLASAIGGRVPEAVVTFEPREEALGAWQEVKGEAMSVNEALYGGAIEGPVRLDGS